jgi:hypothetical protein
MTSPSRGSCSEQERLLQVFFLAISEYHRLQVAQVAALCRGEGFLYEDQIRTGLGAKTIDAIAVPHSSEGAWLSAVNLVRSGDVTEAEHVDMR